MVGTDIKFKKISVGATGNIIMAATRAKGTTIINNSSLEPEIQSLGEFLQKIGVEIAGLGTDKIIITPNPNNDIVVDSPPGIISEQHLFNCFDSLTNID